MRKPVNKKQFESDHDIKKINAFLKKNKVETRLCAEKDQFGDYHLIWDCVAGNLPDHLRELKIAKALRAEFIANEKAAQIKSFLQEGV